MENVRHDNDYLLIVYSTEVPYIPVHRKLIYVYIYIFIMIYYLLNLIFFSILNPEALSRLELVEE